MYQNYCNNYSASSTRLAELRKKSSSAFSKYCDEQARSKQFNGLSIESLLILPIQRMPRYKMLLEEIIKNTEHDHPDLDQLQTALSQIAAVNDSINTKMKDFDAMKRVQNIENRFNGKVTNLVTPSRRYIREGTLCKVERKDDRDCLVPHDLSLSESTLIVILKIVFQREWVTEYVMTGYQRVRDHEYILTE